LKNRDGSERGEEATVIMSGGGRGGCVVTLDSHGKS